MAKRILIMGLPRAGKTTLAQALRQCLEFVGNKVIWLNADRVREEYNDWDFSHEGRIRQSRRMRDLADRIECHYAICDFVAPLEEMRQIFDADFTVWVDTVDQSRYADTNKVFVQPKTCDVRVTSKDAEKWAVIIAQKL